MKFLPHLLDDQIVGKEPLFISKIFKPVAIMQVLNTPIQSFLNYNSFLTGFRHTIMSISSHIEPPNYEEAIKNPCWVQAMKEELTVLPTNQTWTITSLPSGKTAIMCKWV